MKICIIYDSKYGNGKICAEYLESVIRSKGSEAQTLFIRAIKPESLPPADIYVFSSPTHVGGTPWKMKRFLKKVSPGQEGAKYALMIPHMAPMIRPLQQMEKILRSKKMTKVAEDLKIKVLGIKGPLEESYKQKLEELAVKLIGENI